MASYFNRSFQESDQSEDSDYNYSDEPVFNLNRHVEGFSSDTEIESGEEEEETSSNNTENESSNASSSLDTAHRNEDVETTSASSTMGSLIGNSSNANGGRQPMASNDNSTFSFDEGNQSFSQPGNHLQVPEPSEHVDVINDNERQTGLDRISIPEISIADPEQEPIQDNQTQARLNNHNECIEVIDLDSECESSFLRRSSAHPADDDEEIMILSETLNQTDVLHMPIVTQPPSLPQRRFNSAISTGHNSTNSGRQSENLIRNNSPRLASISVPTVLSRKRPTNFVKKQNKRSRNSSESMIEGCSGSSNQLEEDKSRIPAIQCVICLDDIQTITKMNRKVVSTICGHVFCDTCLKSSLKVKKECPTCRKKLNVKQFHPLFLV